MSGVLSRARARAHARAPSGARARCPQPGARTHVHTQLTLPGGATCCPRSVLWQMLVSLATRWGASQLRPAWASAGCTRAWRRQRTPGPLTFPCRRLAGSAASCDPRSLHCPGSRAWRRQRTPDPFTFPCCRFAGSAASCDPRSLHCPGSATAFARRQARGAGHGSTRWSSGRLCASPRLAYALALALALTSARPPRLASPHHASPRLASPRLASPRLASPRRHSRIPTSSAGIRAMRAVGSRAPRSTRSVASTDATSVGLPQVARARWLCGRGRGTREEERGAAGGTTRRAAAATQRRSGVAARCRPWLRGRVVLRDPLDVCVVGFVLWYCVGRVNTSTPTRHSFRAGCTLIDTTLPLPSDHVYFNVSGNICPRVFTLEKFGPAVSWWIHAGRAGHGQD